MAVVVELVVELLDEVVLDELDEVLELEDEEDVWRYSKVLCTFSATRNYTSTVPRKQEYSSHSSSSVRKRPCWSWLRTSESPSSLCLSWLSKRWLLRC